MSYNNVLLHTVAHFSLPSKEKDFFFYEESLAKLGGVLEMYIRALLICYCSSSYILLYNTNTLK